MLIVGVLLVGACASLVGRAVAMPRLRALERVDQIAAYGFHAEPAAAAPTGALDRRPQQRSPRAWARSSPGARTDLSLAQLRRELMSAGLYRVSPLTLVGYRVLAAMTLPVVFAWLATASHHERRARRAGDAR